MPESGGGGNSSHSTPPYNPNAIDFNGEAESEYTYPFAVDPLEDPNNQGQLLDTDGARMAHEIMRRVERYYAFMQASGLYERTKRSYLSRYGLSPDGDNVSYRVIRGGETGALTLFHPNHYANTLTHMATLITSAEPDIQAMAANGDADTVRQVGLADAVMQYIQREKHIPEVAREMVETSLMTAEAWSWTQWDSDGGEEYLPVLNPTQKQQGVKTGDVSVSIHFPQDIIRDTTALQSRNPQWLTVRHYVNRYDLMARFPEHKEMIMAVQRPSIDAFRIEFQSGISESDLIPMYQFYHAKSPALPQGRQCTLVSNMGLLLDGPLEYGEIPVLSMCPARILNTAFGYTPMWDMLSLQQILNALYSGMVTNHVSFVVRRILMARGQPIKQQQMGQNLAFIWFDPNLPEPKLLETPLNTSETLEAIQAIERLFALFSSISDIQRGQVTQNEKALSGSAMMLLVNQSLQFMSGLQAEYIGWYERQFDLILNILKARAEVPMFISIAGQAQRAALKSFTKDDLINVRRIQAEMANPIMHQFAGKMQMVQMMAEMGAFGQGPSAGMKVWKVLRDGDFASVLNQQVAHEAVVTAENEMLLQGQLPNVNEYDLHELHEDPVSGHPAVMANPEARMDQKVQLALNAHMKAHAAARAQRAADQAQEQAEIQQAVGSILGPPPGMLPPGQPGPGGPVPHGPPGQGPNGHRAGPKMMPPAPGGPGGPNPNMPKMPASPPGALPPGGGQQ